MNQKNKHYNSSTRNKTLKSDAILIALLLSVSLIAFIALNLYGNASKGDYVEIYVDNNIFGRYDINKNKTIIIKEYSTVEIINCAVYMKESNCNDKICEKTGYISKVNESIICLPQRIVIRIVSETKSNTSIDGILG